MGRTRSSHFPSAKRIEWRLCSSSRHGCVRAALFIPVFKRKLTHRHAIQLAGCRHSSRVHVRQ